MPVKPDVQLGSTTDHYLTEQIAELAKLKEEIFDAPQEKVSDD